MWFVPLPGLNALFLYDLDPSCGLEHECTMTQFWALHQWAISIEMKHPKLKLKTTIIWSLRELVKMLYFKLWVWQGLTLAEDELGSAPQCSLWGPGWGDPSYLGETLIIMAQVQKGKPSHASTFQFPAWATPTNILTLAKASHMIESKFKGRGDYTSYGGLGEVEIKSTSNMQTRIKF